MRARLALAIGALVPSLLLTPLGPAMAEAGRAPTCTKVGTSGNDVLTGTSGHDVLCGKGGNDVLDGRGGSDILLGGSGADTLTGGGGADSLQGGDGSDILRGNVGADVFKGGGGSDLATYDERSDDLVISIGSGANDGAPGEGDTVKGDVEKVRGGSGADQLSTAETRAVQLRGLAGNDVLTGGPAADTLDGGADSDELHGEGAADTLKCGTGVDTYDFDGTDSVADDCEDETGDNTAPIAVDDQYDINEDAPLELTWSDLIANDLDGDLDPLSVTALSNAVNGVTQLSGSNITFTPTSNFCGTAGFDYTVSDGQDSDIGHVTVNVTCVNDPPVAVDDFANATENLAIGIQWSTLLQNDVDVDVDQLTVTAAFNATNGLVSMDPEGMQVVFTPAQDFCGTAGFDYTVKDPSEFSDTGHVTVTVACGPA